MPQQHSLGLNLLVLAKGDERYLFLFDDAHADAAVRTVGRFAMNPELSLSWHDAAELSKLVRDAAKPQGRST